MARSMGDGRPASGRIALQAACIVGLTAALLPPGSRAEPPPEAEATPHVTVGNEVEGRLVSIDPRRGVLQVGVGYLDSRARERQEPVSVRWGQETALAREPDPLPPPPEGAHLESPVKPSPGLSRGATLADLVEGARVRVQVRRQQDGRLVATEIRVLAAPSPKPTPAPTPTPSPAPPAGGERGQDAEGPREEPGGAGALPPSTAD